jgi:hypothetical protein
MGSSANDFVKFPRTPHLFGSQGTDDDRVLGKRASEALLADPSLVITEKLDGANVGIHFAADGRLVLQARGREITEGTHPQFDLFKRWTAAKTHLLRERLQTRFILFGEWLYARHSLHYRALPHYLIEFDLYDKLSRRFLDCSTRRRLLEGNWIPSAPLLHVGKISLRTLTALLGESAFDSQLVDPSTGRVDQRMEGLYLKTEKDGFVTRRAKFVRPLFAVRARQSDNWRRRPVVANRLAPGVDIWA